jgi:tetratricopeptide (TPR) repeat protein
MRLYCAALFAASALAGNAQLLSLASRAQSDFERVALVAQPQLDDATACIQSQAALLPVALPPELAVVYYRKGYCTLVGALVGHEPAGFPPAAAAFDKAIAASAPPVSSGLLVMASIARLEGSLDQATLDRAQGTLARAIAQSSCGNSAIMDDAVCHGDLSLAHLWIGWVDWRDGNLIGAAREFALAPPSAWADWIAGMRLFDNRHFDRAARRYQAAIDRWPSERSELFWPQPDIGLMLTDLGGAQLLAGDPAAAIATLDRAIKDDPQHARTFYLRARAKELTGQAEAAETDYSLASRTAFASAHDLASGEAHFYRGILLYRRKDFPRAEAEFASALNFDIPQSLRADTDAWRHLAAVASGSCGASRQELARSLGIVSPYFPRREAQAAIAACTVTAWAVPAK